MHGSFAALGMNVFGVLSRAIRWKIIEMPGFDDVT
jgi:hypothetical protein